ncbi:MAG: 1,6-anhydro-N-acetylmuramyl-L-alanine amidase AmpD [Methyloversatilis sp.]|nr:1,6-anhydro-N-acetylmuramyl-L-alanine amidase AmpD [Methyloversatilis sp.]
MTHTDLVIGADGWCAAARRVDSPNRDPRPDDAPVSLIVLHSISLPPGDFGGPWIEHLFTNRLDPSAHPYFVDISALRVSSHFVVRRNGELLQFVSTLERAWHAGVSSWQGRSRCNDFSVGIEFEGCNVLPFEAAQYARARALIGALRQRHPIADVVGHSDVAPGRKTDPGACFDWSAIGIPRP